MSVTIDTPMVLTQLKAEALPLPESRPDTPNKADEPANKPSDMSPQAQAIPMVIVQVPETDDVTGTGAAEDVQSDANSAIGSHKFECSNCCSKPAAFADAHYDEIEQTAADGGKSDTEEPESASDLKTAMDVDGNTTTQHVTGVDANSPEVEVEVEVEVHGAGKDFAATKSSEQAGDSADVKFMDPNDTENNGNVAKTFFTSELGDRLSSVHEQGEINLKFSEMADLFIKTADADGRVFVFQVYSATLEAASTVFYDMIYTSNTRGNKEAWVWELKDSVIGLKVMFFLLHLSYPAALFNQEPDSHQVYEVLSVLAKYGIRDEAFHPFVKSWTAGFRKGLDRTRLTYLERLFAAHKLGDFKTLKISIRKVAHDVEISEDGSMLLVEKPIQEVVPITDELVANIRAVRSEDLRTILEPLKTAYEALMGETTADQEPANFCKSTDGHDDCNEKLLGSLLGNLRRQKLRPVPTPSTYFGSVGTLAEKVSQMDIRGLIVPNLEPHKQRHGRCKLGQDDVAKQILECKAFVPIYDDLVEHMVVTNKRVGTSKAEKDEFEDYKSVFNKSSIKYDEGALHAFWGWDENAKSSDTVSLFPTDDSDTDEESDSKGEMASLDHSVSVISAA